MEKILKIILTNWINVIAIFFAVFIVGFISAMINDKFSFNEALFGTTYSVIGYGMIFWLAFFASIIILDTILFSIARQLQYVNYKLIIEWVLISLPFLYWFFKYSQWIFLIAVLAFVVGQYLRQSYILKILK
jgi:hypothetical protein